MAASIYERRDAPALSVSAAPYDSSGSTQWSEPSTPRTEERLRKLKNVVSELGVGSSDDEGGLKGHCSTRSFAKRAAEISVATAEQMAVLREVLQSPRGRSRMPQKTPPTPFSKVLNNAATLMALNAHLILY